MNPEFKRLFLLILLQGFRLEQVEIHMASLSKLAILFLVLFLVDRASVTPFVHGQRDVRQESKNVAKTIEVLGYSVSC